MLIGARPRQGAVLGSVAAWQAAVTCWLEVNVQPAVHEHHHHHHHHRLYHHHHHHRSAPAPSPSPCAALRGRLACCCDAAASSDTRAAAASQPSQRRSRRNAHAAAVRSTSSPCGKWHTARAASKSTRHCGTSYQCVSHCRVSIWSGRRHEKLLLRHHHRSAPAPSPSPL